MAMASLQWLLYASIIFLVVLLKIFSRNKIKKLNLPPSPRKLPIIGNLHQLGNNPPLSFLNLAKKHGPIFHLQLGQIPAIVASSAKIAQELMKTHDLVTLSRPEIYAAKHLLYNSTDVGFTPYGAYWRSARKICIQELLSAKRVQSFSFVRKEEVQRLVYRISESYPSEVNLTKILELYSNDIICRMALGRDFSAGGDFDRHGFRSMLEEFQTLLGGFDIAEFFPSIKFVHNLSGLKSTLQHLVWRFNQFFDELIDEHLKSSGEKRQKDLVDVLLDIHKSGSSDVPLTIDNVKAIILDMFAGGTSVVTIAIDWVMAELLKNPKSLDKTQAEVRSLLGERREVQESDLPNLHYMKAVIKETLRLHPPAPLLIARESIQDIKINQFDIPAKTRIYVNAWAIGRDPKSWKNPEMFEPERFLGSNIDFKGQHFEFIPFGAGRRICPGITLGMANIELALAQLLHSIDLELPKGISPKDLDMTDVFGLTMHRKGNLMVIAKPRFS